VHHETNFPRRISKYLGALPQTSETGNGKPSVPDIRKFLGHIYFASRFWIRDCVPSAWWGIVMPKASEGAVLVDLIMRINKMERS